MDKDKMIIRESFSEQHGWTTEFYLNGRYARLGSEFSFDLGCDVLRFGNGWKRNIIETDVNDSPIVVEWERIESSGRDLSEFDKSQTND